MELNDVVEMALETNKDEERISSFLFEGFDGKCNVIGMPLGRDEVEKEVTVRALKQLIEINNVETYWLVAPSYTVSKTEITKRLHEELVKAKENGTKEAMKEFLTIAMQLKNVPSENPARREILMICQFDKKEGTRLVVVGYHRDEGGKAIYEEPEYQAQGGGMIMTVWNVWTPVQIHITEKEVEKDEKDEDGKYNAEEENGKRNGT